MYMKKDDNVKAMVNEMSKRAKTDMRIRYEYTLAGTNQRVGVANQEDIINEYPRNYRGAHGASKIVFTEATKTENRDSFEFEYVVIKRMKAHCLDWLGNQVFAEADTYSRLVADNDTDCVCPVIKYFGTKSDKHPDRDDAKQMDNAVIIAQKASNIGSMEEACETAQFMNANEHERYINQLTCESSEVRYEKLKRWATRHELNDVINHPENCGVIYDYAKRCYKAVIIDYAL